MTTYSTHAEAVERLIVEPIEAGGEVADARSVYDIEAIANIVITQHADGYGYAERVDYEAVWSLSADELRADLRKLEG